MNNKLITLIIVVSLIVGLIIYLEGKKVDVPSLKEGGEIQKVSSKDPVKVLDGMEYPLSPELAGISSYLNTEDEIKISDFEGKAVLIDFWTYTCINCIRTLPYLISWDEKYRDKGLVIIGVHSPEFEFEKEKDNVQKAIDRYGIKYSVVLDNERGTWNAFNNRYWPAKYLIDSDGYIRYTHFGEGAYEETEMKIQELLLEAGYNNSELQLTEESILLRGKITPELYAGAVFALPREQYIGNKKTGERNELYNLPNELYKRNVIYLDGNWTHNADNLQLDGKSGIIALDFTASEVNIVAAPRSESEVIMDVNIDGSYVKKEDAGYDVQFDENRAFVIIDEDRLYNIFKGNYGDYRIDLNVSENFTFNAFTFG